MSHDAEFARWANKTWYDTMESFAAGQAGMIADADFFAATYEDPKKSKIAGKVGYALLPAGPGGSSACGMPAAMKKTGG